MSQPCLSQLSRLTLHTHPILGKKKKTIEEPLNLDVLPLGRLSFDGKASRVAQLPLPAMGDDPLVHQPMHASGSSLMGLTSMRDMDEHPRVVALRAEERTLRALMDLDKAAIRGGASHRHVSTPPSGASLGAGRLYDPDVSRLNELLLKLCSMQRPGGS